MGRGGGDEPAVDLVGELALRPQAAEGVDELLELGGDVTEAGRCAEDNGVGPLDVLGGGLGDPGGGRVVGGPGRVGVDGGLRGELSDLEKTDLGAGLDARVVELLGDLRDRAGGRVVDDGELDGSGDIVDRSSSLD
jgi:hypothetical protein